MLFGWLSVERGLFVERALFVEPLLLLVERVLGAELLHVEYLGFSQLPLFCSTSMEGWGTEGRAKK